MSSKSRKRSVKNIPNVSGVNENVGDKVTKSDSDVKEVVFTYGRFQPPTAGHAKLFQKLESMHSPTTDVYAFVSHTTDPPKKNPLTAYQKVKFIKKMHPGLHVKVVNCAAHGIVGANGVIKALRAAYGEDFPLKMVVGEDPDQSFDWVTKQGIKLVELARPDIAEMSGTTMRAAARGNSAENREKFTRGVKMGAMTNANVEELRGLLRARQGGGKRRTRRLRLRKN